MKNEQTETTDDNYRYREEIKEVLCLNSSLSNNDNNIIYKLRNGSHKESESNCPTWQFNSWH